MKICMIEACDDKSVGSIGAFFVRYHAKLAGFNVDILREPQDGYDIELISVHHSTNYVTLAQIPQKAKVRIVGGHPTATNPRPAITYSDVICVGEGESWIKKALILLQENHLNVNSLESLSGTIICKDWVIGSKIPKPNFENPLPENPPYLNHANTRSAAWYIEVARGCPFKCSYCELGNSIPYRFYSINKIKSLIDRVDRTKTKKINFFAPDEASHPQYADLYNYIATQGYSAPFSSMRIDSVLRNGIHEGKIKKNHLIRVGLDGLTHGTRKKVRKDISNQMVIDYFSALINAGFIQFKVFMIIGYPWEKVDDFNEFEALMQQIVLLPEKKNISIRMKWTPLIPTASTPLYSHAAKYDFKLVQKIKLWHTIVRNPQQNIGVYITQDGQIMSYKNWKNQCELAKANETYIKEIYGR